MCSRANRIIADYPTPTLIWIAAFVGPDANEEYDIPGPTSSFRTYLQETWPNVRCVEDLREQLLRHVNAQGMMVLRRSTVE